MGMAASQARYLEITARKTNVEYAGQQVNQQRTALANQSSGLFTQLMGLQVPTAPSTSNYTKTSYSFNDGQNNCTIDSVKPINGDPNYNSSVTYSYPLTAYTGVAKTRTDLGVRLVDTATDDTYWLTNGAAGGAATNQTKLAQCTTTDTNYATDKTAIEQIIQNKACSTNFSADYTAGITNIYKYTSPSGTTNYYSLTDLEGMPSNGAAASLTGSYASDISSKKTVTENAYLTKTDSGRYSTIQLQSESATLSVATTTTTDENAYNDAMNNYNYQTQAYNQQVNALNAKTEVIQEQDRTLELQLKQLDTEQEALQTEMESVKKVIDKNIEQTFKTFAS